MQHHLIKRKKLSRKLRHARADYLKRIKAPFHKFQDEDLFKKLAKLGLTRVLVEGGGTLATSLLESNLVDKLILFTAGIILDKDGIDGINIDLPDAISLDDYDRYSLDKSTIIGNDVAHFWNIK